jgi:uncharacterized protein
MDTNTVAKPNFTNSNLKKGKTKLIILQATSFCNLDCSYCYLPNRDKKNKFDVNLLPILMQRLIDDDLLANEVTICWHVGEPLIMDHNFYRKAFEIILSSNNSPCKIRHNIQTNLTLITEDHCKVFKEFEVSMGISIDGPQFINDLNRNYRNGRSSFLQTMKGLNLIQKYGIDCSVIAVLTKEALKYPNEIFNFFLKNKIPSFGFNIDEIEGINISSTHDTNNIEEFRDFFTTIFKLTNTHSSQIQNREFTKFKNNIFFGKGEIFNTQITPLSNISVDTEGNFSTFSPELLTNSIDNYNFILGNLHSDKFTDIYDKYEFQSIYNEIQEGVSKCRLECDFFEVCGGGSPSNKLFENGTFASSETLNCKLMKQTLANVVVGLVNDELSVSFTDKL